MLKERRDSKGRLLRNNERQRSDGKKEIFVMCLCFMGFFDSVYSCLLFG
jgi:hypothetical protein